MAKENRLPTVVLAGNPNVGKSSIFNKLTGMRQHTGNWTGKTVAISEGICKSRGEEVRLVDLPGTYSLTASSPEEELAAEYIRQGEGELVVVVCDATAPTRGLGLALQILDLTEDVILCLNLADEAARRGVTIDVEGLSRELGIPVLLTSSRSPADIRRLTEEIFRYLKDGNPVPSPDGGAIGGMSSPSCEGEGERVTENSDTSPIPDATSGEDGNPDSTYKACDTTEGAADALGGKVCGNGSPKSGEIMRAEELISKYFSGGGKRDMRGLLDRLLTGRVLAFPALFLLLVFILYLTVTFANYPSELLSLGFSYIGERLLALLVFFGTPPVLSSFLYDGIYSTLSRIVSVMLPPMAIFFPLFTLLEDIGVLPRIAYVLDLPLRRAGGCGKQALTMCMGLGCNAAGIVGCRIIDSPRERRLAILTNALMPCNGRFPTIILLSGLFLSVGGALSGLSSALALASSVTVGVFATLLLTFILSNRDGASEESFFVMELPPYRKPDFGAILVRSFIDRTLLLLGRAVLVAIPAGAVLWCLSYFTVGGVSLLGYVVGFLDPLGRVMGLDGVMLAAFILGTPANEIVLPVALMGYTAVGIAPLGSDIPEALFAAGWTPVTALCSVIFCLMHWPCATSLITVYRETGSLKDTLTAAVAPTALGLFLCLLVSFIGGLFV